MESHYSESYLIVPLALAPIAGHAFSPFLKGKGGKAIAVTFGVWSALTGFKASLALAVILAVLKVNGSWYNRRVKTPVTDGLQVVSGMLLLSVYLYISKWSAPILWVWFGSFVILVYTHRFEWRTWLRKYSTRERKRT